MTDQIKDSKELSPSNIQQLKAELIKSGIGKIAGWTVTIVGAIISLLAVALGFYIKAKLPEWIGTVPPGTVIALDQPGGCKSLGEGWTDFEGGAGRIIIGTGRSTAKTATLHEYQTKSGEEAYLLDERHLPKHAHEIATVFDSAGLVDPAPPALPQNFVGGQRKADNVGVKIGHTSSVGASSPISAMPPTIALHLCKKV